MSSSRKWFVPIALLASVAIGPTLRADDTKAARQRIENMSPTEKEQLRRRQESFEKLDPAKREQLRELHEKLQTDANSERLNRVMHGYCTWLKRLPLYRQAELRELEPAERIERIKQLRKEQAGRLTDEDMKGLSGWMEQHASKHKAHFQELLSDRAMQATAGLEPEKRRGLLASIAWRQWLMGRSGTPPQATDEDLTAVRTSLTEKTRKRLESEPTDKQWQTLCGWVRYSFRHRMSSRRFRGHTPPELQKELDRFFEEELDGAQRDRLLSLPADELQRELWRTYVSHERPGEQPMGRSFGPGQGRQPGPPGGPRGGPPGPDRNRPRPQRGPHGGPPPDSPRPKGPPRDGPQQ